MNRTLSSTDVIGLLRTQFPSLANDRVHIFDTEYAILEDAGADDYFDDLALDTQAALSRWKRNAKDCDKYARTVVWLAFMGHASFSTAETGIAVGIICYQPDHQPDRHAATLILTAKKGKAGPLYQLRVFDAKERCEMHLTNTERASVYRIML